MAQKSGDGINKEDNDVELVHWVEFRALRDLFSFIITKSIPGQQFLSVIRYRDHTYVLAPVNDKLMIFFCKEQPKAQVYAWDAERDEFMPQTKSDRTKVNILIQEVVQDSLIQSVFYGGK